MVGIAQLVERRVVVADVAGSSPVTHPDGKAPWILRNLDPRGFSHVRTEVVPCRGVPTPMCSRTEVVASGDPMFQSCHRLCPVEHLWAWCARLTSISFDRSPDESR